MSRAYARPKLPNPLSRPERTPVPRSDTCFCLRFCTRAILCGFVCDNGPLCVRPSAASSALSGSDVPAGACPTGEGLKTSEGYDPRLARAPIGVAVSKGAGRPRGILAMSGPLSALLGSVW
jgi:hypothetical protein